MRRVSHVGRTLAVAGLVLGLVAVFATTRVSAQADEVELTIHVLTCPTDADGDIFEACHDNRLEDVDFEIAGTLVTSDEDGVASLDNPPSGEVTISELDFAEIATAGEAFVYCSVQPGGSPVLTSRIDGDGEIFIDVPDDTEVHCDWYNRTGDPDPTATETPDTTPTSSGGGGGNNATKTAEAEGTTTLPDTGAGPDGGSSGANFAFGLGLIVLAIGGLAYGLRRRPGTTDTGI